MLSKKSTLQEKLIFIKAGSKEKARLTLFEQSELSRNLKKVVNRVHTESWKSLEICPAIFQTWKIENPSELNILINNK